MSTPNAPPPYSEIVNETTSTVRPPRTPRQQQSSGLLQIYLLVLGVVSLFLYACATTLYIYTRYGNTELKVLECCIVFVLYCFFFVGVAGKRTDYVWPMGFVVMCYCAYFILRTVTHFCEHGLQHWWRPATMMNLMVFCCLFDSVIDDFINKYEPKPLAISNV